MSQTMSQEIIKECDECIDILKKIAEQAKSLLDMKREIILLREENEFLKEDNERLQREKDYFENGGF